MTVLASPLGGVLAALTVLYAVGIGWGLPASDGWDNDGVAPRDFLAGLVLTWTPGKFYTYPPVHLALLGVLTAPITALAAANAASLSASDVVREILDPSYMTSFALVARAVSVVMAVGIAWAMAAIVTELRGPRAAAWTAAVCGTNLSLTYYAHTTNLDVPYLFWGSLAALSLVRAIVRHEPRRLRAFAVFAVLAIGTKDQAYGLFLLSAPVVLGAWLAFVPEARAAWRTVVREAVVALGWAVALFAVVDAVVFNPTGFRARVAFLLGGASQDFASYSNDTPGRLLVLADCVSFYDRYYPLPVVALVLVGLGAHVFRHRRAALVAGLVPLVMAVSYTLAFNCVARRTDHRFVLPQWTLASVYAGLALDELLRAVERWTARWGRGGAGVVRWAAHGIAASVVAIAAWRSIGIDALFLGDPRYDAERWLAANVPQGETIETYGLNVYFPRFPEHARVSRVGPDDPRQRNPLPGVIEVQAAFDAIATRCPRFVVLSQGWVWRYLISPNLFGTQGRILPRTQVESSSDTAAHVFFERLVTQQAGYKLAHVSKFESAYFPPLEIHSSTAREIWIYERQSPSCP